MKINKIYFIRSSFYTDNHKLVKSNRLFDQLTIKNLAELALPLLAAYTPQDITCEMDDDCLNEINFESDAEIIAISGWIVHKDRMIELAKIFKSKNKIVVGGGYLATMHPEYLELYFDSLCIGEGDQIWPQMIRDIQNDQLKKIYVSDFTMPLNNIPIPRYDLIKRRSFLSLGSSYPVQATRGCPFYCDYCSIMTFYQKTYRHRPIADIIRDIKAHGSKEIHFIDDNLMENKQYAKELFKQMIGLKVRWGVQATINIANDQELLDLAYQSGCRLVVIGMESIDQSSLDRVSKPWTNTDIFTQAIKKIQDSGIGVHALIIFGLPNDTPEIFQKSVNYLHSLNVVVAEFFILTPYPKTPLGKKYLEEGKIFDFDLSHYREPYVVFKHDNMTADQIQDGYWHAFKSFYTLPKIFKRLIFGGYKHKSIQFFLNIYYWLKIKRKIVPTHFQRANYLYKKNSDYK